MTTKIQSFTDPVTGMTGTVINDTDVPTEEVLAADWVPKEEATRQLADALVQWSTRVLGPPGGRRNGSLFDRDRFISPNNPLEQMRTAYEAAKDDVVGGFLNSSESLAFSSIRMECGDEDEEDVWSQIMDQISIEARIREIWRELNIVSQVYIAVWYGEKSYKLRGKSLDTGIKRKKRYSARVSRFGPSTATNTPL